MEQKKQTLILIIGVVFLILVMIFVLVYFLVIKKPSISDNTAAPKANDPSIESRVTIVQNDVYLFDFPTEEIPETRALVQFKISPILSFYTTEDMKSFKIKNIHVETARNYNVAIVFPGHVPNNLLQYDMINGTRDELKSSDIQDYGNTIEYNVVDSAGYYDEVYKTSGITQWLIVVKDLGEYNYTEIFNRDHYFDGANILEYAGVTGGDLNMSFYFDAEIVFEDGQRYMKRFSSTIEGDKYMADQFYNPKLNY